MWGEMVSYAEERDIKGGNYKKLNLPFENKLLALPRDIRERMAQGVEDFVYNLLTRVFNAQDTAPLALEAGETPADGGWGWLTKPVLTNMMLVGCFYFFVKFIRYALWSWAPYFLDLNFGLDGDDAGYLSTVFDVTGIAGVMAAGFLSDTVFKSRRAFISLLFMLGMSGACVAMVLVGASSPVVFAVILGVVGFTLYGPDALMTGAGAMDIGSRRGATFVAGVINGMGSVGSVVQELAIGKMYDDSGGDLGPIFGLLMGAAVGATVLIGVVVLRNRMGRSDV